MPEIERRANSQPLQKQAKDKHPLITKAAVRQLISLSLTGLIVFETVVQNSIDATVLVGIYGTVLGFYFGDGD